MLPSVAAEPTDRRASDTAPSTGWLYILHGDDELGQAEALAGLRSQLKGDPALAELNTNVLDGRQLTIGELRHVCDSIPFLEDRRLVLVHGLLTRLAPEGKGREQGTTPEEEPAWKRTFISELLAYLPGLPVPTRLVFVEREELKQHHPVLRFALEQGRDRQVYVECFRTPPDEGLPGWIQHRARRKGGTVESKAALLLAALVGRDLRLLDLEIDKLLAYADGRAVTRRDVQLLVSRARETIIWDLVDCIGSGKTDRSLKLLHGLLDDLEEPLYVLAMLARQVRILMQVSELLSQGLRGPEIAKRAELHPFVAQKAAAQAQVLDMARLEAAHERLVETDWAIKTGQIGEVLALDLLVASLSGS